MNNLIEASVKNPVKVAVGVLLVALFGYVALTRMPIQLTPEVQTPTISVRTSWPGASPQEFEREIIDEQEEFLKSVGGVTKMSSSSYGQAGRITLEFAIGTNMNEALLEVNSQLQQVPDYPEDSDRPVISTSDTEDRPIAWFVLGPRPPEVADFDAFVERHPDLADELEPVRKTLNTGLAMFRLRELAAENTAFEELLPNLERDVSQMRRFVEDNLESALERVPGVGMAEVRGGLEDELQVIVDPEELAARGVTITDVRDVLRAQNADIPAGEFEEGKRLWVVRTLGRFESPEQVENQLLTVQNGAPVYVGDVAEVKVGFKDPQGQVRRFGKSTIIISVIRETGANVLDVMAGLRKVNAELNAGILAERGLTLTQLYDETDYIYSALDLVQSNIFIGGALTMIVLMAFLHLNFRTVLTVPLILGTALAANYISPWFFVLTLLIVITAGLWFARAALVVGLAIPTSIIGTFLIMDLFGRSLNVISLAGLAFAVGMFVDNAIVVLENIYRRHDELGEAPFTAAVRGTKEVWGAVLAATLTNIAIFLPVFFIQEEAGQLFRDIALAISAALALSLIVSLTVIPACSARLFHEDGLESGRPTETSGKKPNQASRGVSRILAIFDTLGGLFIAVVTAINRWALRGVFRRLATVGTLVALSVGLCYAFWPDVEYLPTGNRNLIFGTIRSPTGYNFDEMAKLGMAIEENLRPYWDVPPPGERPADFTGPVIKDYFYVVHGWRVFIGVQAEDPARARDLIPLVQEAGAGLPGTVVTANQSSLFGRGLSGGRTIDVEISGPELPKLVEIGREVLDRVGAIMPEAQMRANPDLDLSSPEIHIKPKLVQASQMGISGTELGYVADALVEGAYSGDYYLDGEKIDLTIVSGGRFAGRTQDFESLPIATPIGQLVPLGSLATVTLGQGPEQIDHRESMRAVTVEVTPPTDIPLQQAIRMIRTDVVAGIRDAGMLEGSYRIDLAGTADKLDQTWDALWYNLLLALLITYMLMAALFESWLYPFVIILSVPLGAVGGILGLEALNYYLGFLSSMGVHGVHAQQLDVLTMLGFIILIGTVVNNPILIVHQALNHIREGYAVSEAVLESTRTRIRPIFMTMVTTVLGLLPLVLFPGSGSELYRGLGAVLLGGLIVSTIVTLVFVPSLFTLSLEARQLLMGGLRRVRGMSHSPDEEKPKPHDGKPNSRANGKPHPTEAPPEEVVEPEPAATH